jgi:hypothetical protein
VRSPGLPAIVVFVVAGVFLVAIRPDLALRQPAGEHRVFEADDAAWLQQAGPLFGVAAPLSPSTWLAAAVAARPTRPESKSVNCAAALLVAGAVALLACLVLLTSGSRVAALGTAAAMATGPGVWALATTAEGTLRPALGVLLVLVALLALLASHRGRGDRTALMAAIAAFALAALDDLSLLAIALPLCVLATRTSEPHERAPVAEGVFRVHVKGRVAVVLLVAILVVAAHAVSSALLWSAQPGAIRRMVPGPGFTELLVHSWRWPGFPHDSASSILWTRLRDLASAWFADLRVLGTGLAVLGLLRAAVTWPTTTAALVLSAAIIAVAGVLPGTTASDERWLVLAPGAWVLAGLGLTWIERWPVAGARAAVVLLVGILPLLNVAAVVARSAETRDVLLPGPDVFERAGRAPPVVVASAPGTDRLVHRALPGKGTTRVPLRRDCLEVVGAGRAVVSVSPSGQRLELLGARMLPFSPGAAGRLRLSRLQRLDACIGVTGLWADVSTASHTGRLGLNGAPPEGLSFYFASARPLRLRLGAFEGRPEPAMTVDAWARADGRRWESLADVARDEGLPLDALPAGVGYAYRVVARPSAGDQGSLALALGGLPEWAWARAAAPAADQSTVVCAGPGGVDLAANLDDGATIVLDHRDAFGDGWHEAERAGRDLFRWTASVEAEMFWRLDVPADVEVIVEAVPSAGEAATQSIGLRVDGAPFGDQVMTGGAGRYSWRVPASALRDGVTPVTLTTSGLTRPPAGTGDERALGVRVARVVVRRLD